MTEKLLKPFQAHISGQCDFDFSQDPYTIISVGSDLLAKKLDLKTGNTLEVQDIDETYAIATNPINRNHIAYGGQQEKVEMVKEFDFSSPFLAMKLQSHVKKIAYSPKGEYLAAFSIGTTFSIYDISNDITHQAKPPMESVCLNIQFSLDTKYIAATSCDGLIYIYSLKKILDGQLDCLVKTCKISSETRMDTQQILLFSWHPTSNILALPGNLSLQFLIEKPDKSWDYSISSFKHNKPLVATIWNIKGTHILTACLENKLKLWDYHTKQLLESYNPTNNNDGFYQIRYSPFINSFVILDKSGCISIWEDPKHNIGEELKHNLGGEAKRNLGIEHIPESNLVKGQQNDHEKMEIQGEGSHEMKVRHELRIGLNENSHDMMKLSKQSLGNEVESHADVYIDCKMQSILYSSSTAFKKDRRFLCWNLDGSIILRNDRNTSFIDIEFSNKSYHKSITFLNKLNLSMGVMNEKGAILASRADEINEDEYENETNDEITKQSVAIGSDWCAVITDYLHVRIFTQLGLEIGMLELEKPLVTCAGYENLLAIVYQDGVPFMGCQSMKMKLINANNMNIMYQGSLPLSPYSNLNWFGFSDSGLLISYDSKGVIRAFYNLSYWVPIWTKQQHNHHHHHQQQQQQQNLPQNHPQQHHRPDDNTNPKKFWLIGMSELNFIGVFLDKSEDEPSAITKPNSTWVKSQVPFLNNLNHNLNYVNQSSLSSSSSYQTIHSKQLMLDHERFRHVNWLNNRVFREKGEPLYYNSESIKDANELMEYENKLNRDLLAYFKGYLENGKLEKALHFVNQLENEDLLNVCKKLGDKLGNLKFIKALDKIYEAKEKGKNIQNLEKKKKLVFISKEVNTNQEVEKQEQPKKGLSMFAVKLPNRQQQQQQAGLMTSEHEHSKSNTYETALKHGDELNITYQKLDEEKPKSPLTDSVFKKRKADTELTINTFKKPK